MELHVVLNSGVV